MPQYVIRRLLIALPILWGLLTINFFLIHAAPGDPTDIFFNPDMDPEARANLKRIYGLDLPIHEQYLRYLKGVIVDLEFGYSFAKKRPVIDEILDALPNTLVLSGLSLCLELFLGILMGIISAVRQYSAVDNALRVAALTLYSTPAFYLGLILLFLFAGGIWYWFPGSGMVDLVRHEGMSFAEKLWDRVVHLVLPTIALGLGSAASVSRYMRGELLEVIRQDYIRTARAKGLAERSVIWRHALRNAMIPIITLVGLSFPVLFSGAVIVENVFAWPGMGRVAVDAAFQRDYPMFLAVNLIFAVMVVAGNLLSDVLYGLIDPRVKLD